MIIRSVLLVFTLLFAGGFFCVASASNQIHDVAGKSERKVFVEKYEDRKTGCKITYEYYKAPDGTKIMHGKYKRHWSLPKGERSTWSGKETITATFVDNMLNGTVIINCDKQKWKRKNEFTKGKGRIVKLVPVESYVARNLKLEVKNDTLSGSFYFELGNLRYETIGKVNPLGEMHGKYTVYEKVDDTDRADTLPPTKYEWRILEQYLCDPDYTYKDAIPKIAEVNLGYGGTSRAEQIRIKIPRLRLSINPL